MKLSKVQVPANDSRPGDSRNDDLIRERLGTALGLVDQLGNLSYAVPSNGTVTDLVIRSIIKHRRYRDHFFGAELFADPAWDILLHLYASHLSQHRMTICALCEGAAVPATTALRWLAQLEKKGFIERRQDIVDKRRYFVSLTVAAVESMDAYFRTVSRGQALI